MPPVPTAPPVPTVPTVPTTGAVPTVPPVPSLPPLPSIVVPTIVVPTIVVPTIAVPTVPPVTAAGAIPPPTLQPIGLGTDPALDQLAQQCYDGSMEACDQLFQDAFAASPWETTAYQEYADTCAGRQPPGTTQWCVDTFPAGSVPTTTPGTVPTVTVAGGPPSTTAAGTVVPPPTQQPTGLGTDAALDALALGCYNGDMAACDSLWDTAPLGSPYRAYADTCAGRQPEGTYRYCQESFPVSAEPRPGP